MRRIVYVDELQHHGVKGMKWGVRREFKKQFNSDYENVRRKVYNKHIGDADKVMNALDEKYKKRHSGYEYGDLYEPDWKKSRNKDVREYSKAADRHEYADDKARSAARSAMKAKYGASTVKAAWKLNKKTYKSSIKSQQYSAGKSAAKSIVSEASKKTDYNELIKRGAKVDGTSVSRQPSDILFKSKVIY